MFKIKSLFFALAVSQASASSIRSDRQLSEELFLSYEPQTTVTDHAAIDLDQQAIENQLALGTSEGRQNALKVYTNGAYSKSFAVLTLDAALANEVGADVEVIGKTAGGDEVRGTVMETASAGATTLRVQYATTSVQDSYVGCQVGGNPDPKTDGCFQPSGSVSVGAFGDVAYSYNVASDNLNGRTIQGFSTDAKAKMYECEFCPYKTYEKFYDYYGAFDYANQWVLSAFNQGSTDFTNGKADFSKFGDEGLNEVIKKGTAYLNIWMYVNREMEDAIDDCKNDCGTDDCNDDQVHAWDEAVAFYTGSIAKKTGEGGVLLYTLAQKRCENFGTCLTTGTDAGKAGVNSKIFTAFNGGKQALQQGKCDEAKKFVDEITSLMTVPLVQGTLRYAHIRGVQNLDTEKAQAEGAAFAAAVLPILHACSASDAQTVYDNMKTGSSASDFAAVKAAFENNYGCMGIACEDVGGLLTADAETYFEGAEPCSGGSGSQSSLQSSGFETGVGLAVGIGAGVFAALI